MPSLPGGQMRRRQLRLVLGSGAALALLVATGWSLLSATEIEGCANVAEGAIVESQRFTPYGMRYSGPMEDGPLSFLSGASSAVPPEAKLTVATLDGRARQASLVTGGAVYAYFLDRPLDNLTYSEFVRLGGIQLHQDPIPTGEGPFSAYLLSFLGERAVAERIGPYDGALTWADPDVNGVRTHNVYWSDGSYNFALITNQSAASVVNLARSLVC